MKRMIAGWVLMLSLGAGVGNVLAQSGPKDEAKKAGEAIKEAGKSTGEAAKHVGKAAAKGTKKVATKVRYKVVKLVNGNDSATCNDGTHQEGKTEAAAVAACASHGGAAKY